MTEDVAGGDLESLADRVRYAPDTVDPETAVARVRAAGPEGRATMAAAVGSMPVERAGAFADAVPLFVEAMDGDHEHDRQPFLEGIARIAAADPAAARPVTDTLVDELTAFNIWVNRAAADALQHVVAACPEELSRIEPLFDHEQNRVQARAASVLAAATARDPTVAVEHLSTCARLANRNSLARDSAIAVLATAGWLDPEALDPAVERLVAIVRNGGDSRGSSPDGLTRGGSTTSDDRTDSTETNGGGTETESQSGPRRGSRSAGTDDRDGGTGNRRDRTGDQDSRRGDRDGGAGSRLDDDADEAELRRLALVALTHVAGSDPESVQSVVPLCVELTTGDDETLARAAGRLLVTLSLQDPPTAGRLGDIAGSGTYFDRRALVEALADASTGLPGREILFRDALDDETRFLRFEAVRQVAGDDPTGG